MDALTKLYYSINDDEKALNPFERGEAELHYNAFCKKYIDIIKGYDEQNQEWEDLMKILASEREQAFKIGFKTAVSLIVSK